MQRVYKENEWGKVSKRIITLGNGLFHSLVLCCGDGGGHLIGHWMHQSGGSGVVHMNVV